ncbi:MAG: YbjN domain-containing protein [Gammaproteobacteria bacterium]
MTLTLSELRSLADAEGLKYFLDPREDALLLAFQGGSGSYHMLILLDVNGQFLQFRTVEYVSVPPDHPHLLEALKLLVGMNFRVRMVKFAWNSDNGEVVAYADVWLQDAKLTQEQFHRMLSNYLPVIDDLHMHLQEVLEGKAPKGITEV